MALLLLLQGVANVCRNLQQLLSTSQTQKEL